MLIKEKHIPIANLDLHRPTQIVSKVQVALPHRFNVSAHTAAWHYYQVRPAAGAAKPEATLPQYCVYDLAHNDYLYTTAWVEKLIRELAPVAGYQAVVGSAPVPK